MELENAMQRALHLPVPLKLGAGPVAARGAPVDGGFAQERLSLLPQPGLAREQLCDLRFDLRMRAEGLWLC